MTPPGDEISLGELARNMAALTEQVRELVRELKDLPDKYVPRSEYELQVGGIKVDISRVDRDIERHEQDIKASVASSAANLMLTEHTLSDLIDKNEERRVAGTRWAIGLAATALIAFLGMGVTIALALPRLLA